jgi:hypothetical protein
VAVFTPFEDLTDPRIERTRVHALFELVVVALCGSIAGPIPGPTSSGAGATKWLRPSRPKKKAALKSGLVIAMISFFLIYAKRLRRR